MMRRRALLAASQTGGGGKVVNRIVLSPYISDMKIGELYIDYNADYPVASTIFIYLNTNGHSGECMLRIVGNEQSGNFYSVDLECKSAEIQVISIDPQEDDTYIYEVVVEY